MFEIFWALAGYFYVLGKGIDEGSNQMLLRQYEKNKGYNLARQQELENMAYSSVPAIRKEFDRMVGRTVNKKNDFDISLSIREISIREGWGYYDVNEAYSDPAYVKLNGGKWPSYQTPGEYYGKAHTGREKALEMIAETDRRKAWIERCPHGADVDVLPMDFKSEEEYQQAVETEFFCGRYAIYRNSNAKKFVAYQIRLVEEHWVKHQRYWSDAELASRMCSWAIRLFGGTGSVGGYLMVIQEKCRLEGIEWDAVLEKCIVGKEFIRSQTLPASSSAYR